MTVAKTLNFRRAADKLRVAQPSLSKQIKDLEHELGALLFHRNTGGASLTHAGEVLLDEAREILERVEMAKDAVREAENGRKGRLVIGNLGAMSAAFLPSALSAFRNKYPNIELELDEMNLQDQVEALNAGAIQVGFSLGIGPPVPSDIEEAEVLQAELAIAMGRAHPLAQKTKVSLKALRDESLLYIGWNERYDIHLKAIQSIFAVRKIKHSPVKRVKSYDSLIALVGGDHGVSIMLPTFNAQPSDNVVFRPIEEAGDDLVLRLSAIWKKGGRSLLAKNFVDVMLSQRNGASEFVL